MTVISALQIGSRAEGTAATLDHILGYESAIRTAGSSLVVMPEALLGGYPKGEDFGARIGFRTQEGREAYRRYWEGAIDVPGPETKVLAGLSARTGASLVIGVIERQGYSLFCTVLFFDPTNGLVAKHRKLMPTGSERLVWSLGDGSTIPVVETAAGRIGAAICWENYMPLFRSAMYAKGIDIWCAPTVDERDIWQCSMRHIAYEARSFLVSACQVQPSPATLGRTVPGWPDERLMIRGGSVIISPMGEIIAGPHWCEEGLVSASIDRGQIAEARYDLDTAGHYARPDVFSLVVDETSRKNVITRNGTPAAVAEDGAQPEDGTRAQQLQEV